MSKRRETVLPHQVPPQADQELQAEPEQKTVTQTDEGLVANQKIDPGDLVYLEADQTVVALVEQFPRIERQPPDRDVVQLVDVTPPPVEMQLTPPMAILPCPLTLPPLRDGYQRRHIELHLDGRQAEALTRLMRGLDDNGARLDRGRRVVSHVDAIRWLLEWVAQSGQPAE